MSEKKPVKRKAALGRGLGALLDDTPSPSTSTGSGNASGMAEIPLDQIEVNPFQPRTDFDKEALQELAESIKIQGIIQPVTVRKISRERYQLISGERRLQASKKAGLKAIPAYVRLADDQQMLEMALIENIQRENLNAIEIALSYQRLISECDLKQEELGDRVGKNRSTVTNYLRLLKLPPDIQAAIRDKKITMGHARALINIAEVSLQLMVFKKILNDDLSVREVEGLARQYQGTKSDPGKQASNPSASVPNMEIKRLQSRLTSHFGSRIQILGGADKGEIRIPYVSMDDLNRILEIINARD